MLIGCKPERVKEDTVRALAHAYVVNTYEVWKCDSKLNTLKKWVEEQKEIHNVSSTK